MELTQENIKTPASIVYEEMTKKKLVPVYELIVDGTGDPNPVFTYKLTCDGESVVGSGRCKKLAKQNAANEMLKKLKIPYFGSENSSECQATLSESIDDELLQPLLDNDSEEKNRHSDYSNAVQTVMKLCVEHSLPVPEFKTTLTGLPHTPLFTTCCTTSNFVEEGFAPNKKDSRRNAALKMIDAIKREKNISKDPECKTELKSTSHISPRLQHLLSLSRTVESNPGEKTPIEKVVICEKNQSLKKHISPEIESQLCVVKESIEKLLQLI
ncbi:RISC-loading complex subunit tarbp2-like [Leptopilina heterotoma]|uniref:RISC-loading complex subunit tarbp2-like n=1 Tax=Leptopilina heterotoma TaxID=63436 RepID=UPI001CA8D061|nr:RISC-loading complex subunit tarbp2-like [Leptopilina heterotoma]